MTLVVRYDNPVDTFKFQRRYNVLTLERRCFNVETTSCTGWEVPKMIRRNFIQCAKKTQLFDTDSE